MKRQFVGIALFLPLLTCLLGAGGGINAAPSSIAFGAGQPNPNPGGKASTLEGKGTYTVDPNETFGFIVFQGYETKLQQSSTKIATANNGAWDATLAVVKGNYDCFATLGTTDAAGKQLKYKTATVNVNVK